MSKNMDCFCRFLYHFLTSEKLVIFLANQSCLSKLYFKLWANEGICNENCGDNLWSHIFQALWILWELKLSRVSAMNHSIDLAYVHNQITQLL